MIQLELLTSPVLDAATLWRTAWWLGRAQLPAGSLLWTVYANPVHADPAEVQKVLEKFSASFRWRMYSLATCEPPREGRYLGYLASDCIVPPEVLLAAVEEAKLNPTCVVVPRAERIRPETLVTLDLYGSGFLAKRARTEPFVHGRVEEAALAVWDSQSAYPHGHQLACDATVYTQLDRAR